jgi:hypothetical protein
MCLIALVCCPSTKASGEGSLQADNLDTEQRGPSFRTAAPFH